MRIAKTKVAVVAFLGCFLALFWAYWPAFEVMGRRWENDPQYSHGYLVPLFAIYLLWHRRKNADFSSFQPSFWGLPVLLAALFMRHAAAYAYIEWFDLLSFIPCLAGVCLLITGWGGFRWAWPGIAFLTFMIPLPYTLEVALQGPLRKIGTIASTYSVQTMGIPAFAEGNIIFVGKYQLGVAEACSGLRMLVIFFTLSTIVALLSKRPYWQRIIIVLSAIPIAVCANVTRITVTALFYSMGWNEAAQAVFHDVAGWLMMVFALVMLQLEIQCLSHLFVQEEQGPLVVGISNSEI